MLRPLTLLVALAAPAVGQIHFTPVTSQAGLEYEFVCGAPGDNLCDMLGGAAAADFDRDGWPDLFLLGGGRRPDRLLLNQGDGTFAEEGIAWGVDRWHLGSGCAVGDFDGDGWIDLFVTSVGEPDLYGPGHHLLYRNLEGQGFEECAARAGVNWTSTSWPDGFGACFGDYDRDGDLDLCVAGWRAVPDPSYGNRLFENRGDGTFEDVTGQRIDFPPITHGFTPIFADMDGDLWPELLLAADFGSSRYFVNTGGAFVETTGPSGVGLDGNGMGATVGDLDGDGLLDWYVTSIFDRTPLVPEIIPGDGNKLYRNLGNHAFEERAVASGVADSGWGWGTVSTDLDHDGDLDLAAVNGFVHPDHLFDPARLWRNEGPFEFRDITRGSGLHDRTDARGLLHLDYDQDGDRDLLLVRHSGTVDLLRNDLPAGGHWLTLRLDTSAHPGLAPDGIGSRVHLRAGGRERMAYLSGTGGYLTSGDLDLHFGLGTATAVEELRVEWMDGQVSVWTDVTPNQHLIISR